MVPPADLCASAVNGNAIATNVSKVSWCSLRLIDGVNVSSVDAKVCAIDVGCDRPGEESDGVSDVVDAPDAPTRIRHDFLHSPPLDFFPVVSAPMRLLGNATHRALQRRRADRSG